MMKKILCLAVSLGIVFCTKADEGMWLLMKLKNMNYENMQKMGLNLTAEELYSVNNSSLKDAIVSLGGFCTGEIISPQGLMLTNHHCAFDAIQTHSSVKNDYLTDGFWAMSKKEELPNEGLTASFFVRMEDVTNKVLEQLTPEMNENQRKAAIKKISDELKKEATLGTHYNADVKSFFEGNEFYLFIYETFQDIRLVGAPPSSIGKFGGDTDNWMWPRHTGDFSLFRVYMSPDGKPAPYSVDNVPYKSKHFLPVSIKGVENNDFAMVLGYPGRTDRFLTSYGVKLAIEKDQPARVKIREKRLAIMKEDMNKSDEVRIKYASTYAQVSNYYKYFQGQTKGLKKLSVYDKKKTLENDFLAWIEADASRNAYYGQSIPDIAAAYALLEDYKLSQVYLQEAVFGCQIIAFSANFMALSGHLANKEAKKEDTDAIVAQLREVAKEHFKDYNAPTDKKVTAAMLTYFNSDIAKDLHPDLFKTIESKYKGDFNKYAEDMFSQSIFADQEKLNKFLDKPTAKSLDKDPAMIAFKSFITNYQTKIQPVILQSNEKLEKGNRLFVDGLRKMNADKQYYPNANFTMRLTYGKVGDYVPNDAMFYKHFTTSDGILEKEDPKEEEFIVPAKLKELIQKRDFGRYADKNGNLVVAFISDNDITGGNSGSPVINGKGHLIGCAFDGNWEAMSGDIAFETELQRTISVDARFILFIIDKYAGATHLINEMTIIQ
ncbi:MAG: S46 family peptidase [Bacteroidetes bacterium]|nr:S46 family peptidase [Bacteroidota bacterium]HET6243678.1 S46 family peptidase [Bacteroidia bacterium]